MFNRNSLANFLLFGLLLLGIFLVYKGIQIYRTSQEVELESCISSLQGYLGDSLKREEIKKVINPSREWKILDNNESKFLFESLDENKRFNCGKASFFIEKKFQNKNELEVLVRQNDDRMEVFIKGL